MSINEMQQKRDAGAVKRYHTKRLIGEQTVAQHTFNALLIVLEIEPNPSLNLIKAVMYHDLPELFTGDIPAPFKWQYPKLAEQLEIAEAAILDAGAMLVELTEYEKQVLKFADMMELVLFCNEQMCMGNMYTEPIMARGLNYLLQMQPFSDTATRMLTDFQLSLLGDDDDDGN